MNRYTISLDGQDVRLCSLSDLSKIIFGWNKLIHFTGVEVNCGREKEFTVQYSNLQSCNVYYSENCAHVNLPLSELQRGEVLFYAALPFFEVLFQRFKIVTMHAAAVELAGKAILILGKSGAGKTSLALSLCLNHRARLIGNDIVRVRLINDKPFAYAGSKYFFLREESIKRNIPDLLDLFPKSGQDSWTNKIYCLPQKLGVEVCNNPVLIDRSYLVHVDDGMKELYAINADKVDTRLYLHENMSRYIRGTAIALFKNDSRFLGYVPSYDTPEFFLMRMKLMEMLISKSKMMYLAGNIGSICQYILTLK